MADQDEDFARFTVYSKTEILSILNSISDRNTTVSASFHNGRDTLLTSILNVSDDGNELVLDIGSDAEMNKRVLQAEELICITNHEKVKIHFIVRGVDPSKFEGRNAFLGDVPSTLVRLQRRDFYRIKTPLAATLKCIITLELRDGATQTIEAAVADISGGGLALVLPANDFPFETDQLLSNCGIDLPNIGKVMLTMRVRSIFEVTLANGKTIKRSGCQFINPSNSTVALIQRYIVQVEQDRKFLE